MHALYELEGVSRSWLEHCRRSYPDKPISEELDNVFHAKGIMLEFGANGFYLGALTLCAMRTVL
jgi:hypothetical protein